MKHEGAAMRRGRVWPRQHRRRRNNLAARLCCYPFPSMDYKQQYRNLIWNATTLQLAGHGMASTPRPPEAAMRSGEPPALIDPTIYPRSRRASPAMCRVDWTKPRDTARWLTTCTGVLWFTASTATAFLVTCYSTGETATWPRQPSQGDAKALLN